MHSLGEAYLSTLKEIRSFGGKLIVNNYKKVIKTKSNKKKKKENLINIELLKHACRLLPSEWIDSLNRAELPLLINNSLKKDEGVAGSYSSTHIHPKDVKIKHLSPDKIVFANAWLKIKKLDLLDLPKEPILIHELGHGIVEENPIIGALEETYYVRRTTLPSGKRSKPISMKGDNFRIGGFVSVYMGKDAGNTQKEAIKFYEESNRNLSEKEIKANLIFPEKDLMEAKSILGRRKRYEIFSTALPAVLTGEYGYLAGLFEEKKDTELRHLILGILAVV